MNPTSTLRLRHATAAAAVAWAALALVVGLEAKRSIAELAELPIHWGDVGGRYAATWVSPAARGVGVRPGDRVIAFEGIPVHEWDRSEGLRPRADRRGATGQGDRRQPDDTRQGGAGDTPEGRAPQEAARSEAAQDGDAAAAAGVFRYRLEGPGGETYEVALPGVPLELQPTARLKLQALLFVLAGVLYFVIGAGVWWLKRDRAESWALLLFCSAMSALLFLSGPGTSPAGWLLSSINTPLIGATTFHLFTTYPIEPAWIVHHPRWRVAPYAAAAAFGALALAETQLPLLSGGLDSPRFLFTVSIVCFCVAFLFRERRRLQRSQTGGRADVMLVGALVGFAPVLGMLVFDYLVRPIIPFYAILPFLLVFPCAVGYGIVRKQLFDIRIAARSSVAYGAVTLAITGLYAFLITTADAVFARFNVNARSPWFSVGFLFFAILAFNPLRNRMQRLVDRLFDRDRAGYREALREISEAMVSMLSLREIGDRILVALTDTMGVERAVVLLVDEDERRLRPAAARGDWDRGTLEDEIDTEHPIVRALWMRREELARADFDDEPDPELREACRDVFDTLEIELLVPILFGVDLLGAIAVGGKFSSERIDADDRQLLRTLANQSAIAIENAKSYDEIAQLNETLEARVEERTRELRETQAQLVQNEKMVSLGQLVAGVAHELNNPIGFIHANLQLIDEYVAKLEGRDPGQAPPERTREALARLLMRSREGTQRVKQIVEDLRAFSRLDQAELQEVDLHEGIERTLSLMTPRLKHGIAVERDYGELPPVRCFAGQLNQVFMNLLMNACDALRDHGTIRVSTRSTPDGVCLEFSDDGPGIPSEIRNRIFEPFFTTKTVGKGTGLGLSISHGIIERHGGLIRVDSTPGKGATFIIHLPLDPSPPASDA